MEIVPNKSLSLSLSLTHLRLKSGFEPPDLDRTGRQVRLVSESNGGPGVTGLGLNSGSKFDPSGLVRPLDLQVRPLAGRLLRT